MDIAVYPRLNTLQLVSHPGGTASQSYYRQVQGSWWPTPMLVTTAVVTTAVWHNPPVPDPGSTAEQCFLRVFQFCTKYRMGLLQKEKQQGKSEASLKFPISGEDLPKGKYKKSGTTAYWVGKK